ncbi:MFS transporter [Mesobacillus zeae]|uniref:MFS transporter n=1 Tax=Mesobacillus zeae TaxID=1917180 RepID=A0A398BD83_9BACI|nr:MFS transporter [Mesobacillus zeae]RID86778.1 MFS transporter [Mesobacillus zeae]
METVQIGSNNSVFKERSNLVLYSAGKTVSVFGTAIYNFALGLYVLKLTGSAFSFALILILGIIPSIILNPIAGVVADRFSKKWLAVSMDLLSGILLVLVYMVSMLNSLGLMLIYTATFLLTVFATFFGVGLESAKPHIVTKKRLMNLNSISKIIESVSTILAPMLGGLVYAIFDIRTFIIINGISFILSGLSILLIDFRLNGGEPAKEQAKTKLNIMADLKDGFCYLSGKKNIMGLFVTLISLNFSLGFAVIVPLPYILITVFGLDAKQFGLIEGMFPVGLILGAIFVKKITEKIAYSVLLSWIGVAFSILMIAIGVPVILTGSEAGLYLLVLYYGITMVLFGFCVALIDIPLSYFLQTMIPDEYRGRVLSIGISLGKVMIPVAIIASGALLGLVPAYLMPIAGGLLFLIINIRSSKEINIGLKKESA